MKNNSRKECFCSFFFFFLVCPFCGDECERLQLPPQQQSTNQRFHNPSIKVKKKKESQIWPVNIKI